MLNPRSKRRNPPSGELFRSVLRNLREINEKAINKACLDETVQQFAEIISKVSGGKVKLFGREWIPAQFPRERGYEGCRLYWFGYDVFLQGIVNEQKVILQVASIRDNTGDLKAELSTAITDPNSMLTVALAYLMRNVD